MKSIFPIVKAALLVLLSVFVTYLLAGFFAYIEIRYLGMGELMKRCFASKSACTNEEFYSAVLEGIFRSDYIYNPLIVLVASLLVSIVQWNRLKFLLLFLSLLPFLVFHLFAGDFGFKSILLSLFYLLLGLGVSLLIHKIQHRNDRKMD